ncbi:EAL domain-containing protein [Marinobacterium sp. LSUCC0821]|uniref:GGDEF/EAL domain-containing response regulator n=1 Tax=Marinobacterium sp. LSUCC0821 TaxID=2668067 RepID=UPI001451E3AF|nr:EAL domain-containing protein [Marinobacterium sp. LSUCC0821]QJD70773.1 EAL domain-containing protein [Marinobacterium sp. LSUCC0821]
MQAKDISAANILIVDDNQANVMLLEDLLEAAQFTNIASLTDPREVLPLCQEKRPDIILLDIRMPYLSGFEVMEQLKETFKESCPPIMVLTAQTDLATKTQALALGAIDFLNKPFDHFEVTQRIRNILSQYQGKHSFESGNPDIAEFFDTSNPESLKKLSLTDSVTGLPNRRSLIKTVFERLAERRKLTSYFIELDGITELSKSYGHELADKAMAAIAKVIKQSPINKQLMIGIWNGNQLVGIAEDLTEEESSRLAERIERLLKGDHDLGMFYFYVSVRIGICRCDDVMNQGNELIRRASLAIPDHHSSCTINEYTVEMDVANNRSIQIENELRRALSEDELFVVYQPKISLLNRLIVGAEALVRWNSRSLGFVGPDEFIPIAERTGLIVDIGSWVFAESLKQLNQWVVSGKVGADFKLAINVSSLQIKKPNFIDFVKQSLAKYQVSPYQVQIELTETVMVTSMEQTINVMHELRSLGLSIAMDDFGTGYSSLSYLQDLPLDVLKIDRSFVNHMLEDQKPKRLIQGMIALAHTFSLEVVVEGIETEPQARMLTNMGCEIAQGYLFYKPLKACDFPVQPMITKNNETIFSTKENPLINESRTAR